MCGTCRGYENPTDIWRTTDIKEPLKEMLLVIRSEMDHKGSV
jgi:hypothetical protein